MSTTFALPGQQLLPQNYGSQMVLYSATERVEAVVDGAPPGPTGRLFVVEPGKPVRVPQEAGRFILEHLGYTGVVRVNETLTDTGVTYDIEAAKQESLDRLAAHDQLRFDAYVRSCVQDYISNPAGAKPVPPPSGSILKIIERRGYDLKRFGIIPLGWENPDKDKRVTDLQAQNADLIKRLEALEGKKGK